MMIAEVIKKYYPLDFSGTVLEVGAALPSLGSSTRNLRKCGWNIIPVEPNPVFCNEFRVLGLPILEYAAYSTDLGETDFVLYPTGLSYSSIVVENKYSILGGTINEEFTDCTAINNGLSKKFDWEFFPRANETKNIKVTALTLNTILQKHYPLLEKINVLMVDVEGFELDVMKGIDLEKYGVEIVVLENIRSYPEYREYMVSQGFVLDKRIDIDDIYRRMTSDEINNKIEELKK